MTVFPDGWNRIKEIFEAALELAPLRRNRFLTEACAGNGEMRREVESLLAAHEAAGDFIESPPAETLQVAAGLEPGIPYQRLGPYRLIEIISSGGMGAVYRAARDDEEFCKQVAIKVIGRGMNSEFILRRFRQERQILAGLSHPNIAMLLDGGTTPDGLPYFVMEFVEGKPILAYCEERNLSLGGRLELFRTVCAAVQYAHKNRVVHRDLKPSNILVTADQIPKLLDFGIARIFDPGAGVEALGQTISTRNLMTPEYASPEQVRGEPATPASDIYSLGVLLYELLTRQRPYRLDTPTPQKIAEAVCRQEPEKPSAAVTRPEEGGAKRASSTLRADTDLVRKLRGDLDNIVLMALRKEPARRYASAEELSEDIRRHLEGLPVKARKGARTYRLGKFLRRHQAAVLAAALAVVILLAAGMLLMRLRDNAGEQRLSTGDRPSPIAEANEYFEKAQLTNRVSWNPPRMMQFLEKALEKDPAFTPARAEYGFFHLIMIDGGLSDDIAWLDKAEQHLTRAIREDPASIRAYSAMAAVSYYRRRPGDVAKYAAAAQRLLPGAAEAGIWLSNSHVLNGEYARAKTLALEILRRDPLYFPARMHLASILQEEGDVAAAVSESEKVLEQNPNMINCIRTLAVAHLDGGNQDRAREALNGARPEDRGNLQIRLAWSLLLAQEGKAAEARQELDERVRRWASLVPYATLWVAETYSEIGDTALGLDWLEKAVQGGDRRLQWFRRDPHLAKIRGHPRFEQILASATGLNSMPKPVPSPSR